ncbi:MAG: ferric reductase-like transmembrane domain-containing protein [Candidatus Accumulibacter necessarius]
MALMSLVLATRLPWLEAPLGGMDRVYRSHKWAGILACAFAALYWLVEMSSDLLKAVIGRQGRVPKEKFNGLLEVLSEVAEDLGEWAIYVLLMMLVITLWQRFPYRMWRFLHRLMPILYLTLAFHAVFLAPAAYWTQPVSGLLALLIARGRCRGQSLPSASRLPISSPCTAASISALGDYTRSLGKRLAPGQPVRVEGPYGRFDIGRQDRWAQQLWVAGGISVTPFLAWLESLQAWPDDAPAAELHYCTGDRDADPFVTRLESLCAPLAGIRLQVHGARLRAAWRGRLTFHQEAFVMR